MATYKVSIVITKGDNPGTILNLSERPEPGQYITLGNDKFLVTEVLELMPPRGDFYFLHATCEPIEDDA